MTVKSIIHLLRLIAFHDNLYLPLTYKKVNGSYHDVIGKKMALLLTLFTFRFIPLSSIQHNESTLCKRPTQSVNLENALLYCVAGS